MEGSSRRQFLKAACIGAVGMTAFPGKAERASLLFSFRRRENQKEILERRSLKLHQAAAVVVDMWTRHGCAGATAGVEALVPKMNRALDALRALGVPIIFAPSGDDLERWRGKPQRTAIESLAASPLPASNGFFAGHKGNGPFTSSCMCKITEVDPETHDPIYHCHKLISDHHQNPNLRVGEHDFFIQAGTYRPGVRSAMDSWGEVAQQELWNFVKAKDITHILYLGIATNMCIINREFGMVQARRMGLTPVLIRDMTEAMTFDGYNPMSKRLDPLFTPAVGTKYSVEFIEENIGASIDSRQLNG